MTFVLCITRTRMEKNYGYTTHLWESQSRPRLIPPPCDWMCVRDYSIRCWAGGRIILGCPWALTLSATFYCSASLAFSPESWPRQILWLQHHNSTNWHTFSAFCLVKKDGHSMMAIWWRLYFAYSLFAFGKGDEDADGDGEKLRIYYALMGAPIQAQIDYILSTL